MDKKQVLQALDYVRSMGKKRKFEQSVELAINFKGIDFKKAENRVEVDVTLPHATGKQGEAKALVFVKDKGFAEQLNGKARVVMEDEIANFTTKDVEEIMRDYTVFLAEGPVMLTVSKHLGQQLAPKGMMPKPIQPSMVQFEQSVKNVSTSTKVTNKKGKFMPVVHTMIGKESFKNDQLADNVMEIYNAILENLPGKEAGIKSVIIKTTMGKPIKVGQKYEAVQQNAAPSTDKGAAQ